MDLKPELKNLTERYQAQSDKKISEQQTIISYVLPFLRYLGYDTSDQDQFRAEYFEIPRYDARMPTASVTF